MRIFLCVATLMAISALSACTPAAFAQGAATGTQVVVVDISRLFEHHVSFKQRMADMKREVQQFDQQIQLRQQELQDKQQGLEAFRAGTTEYANAQREIANMAGAIQAEAALKGDEFRKREAQIYFDVYTEIQAAVAQFAQHNGIQLVIRFNSSDIEANDPQSVLRTVNQMVVFQSQRDITEQILLMLNQQAGAGAPPTR